MVARPYSPPSECRECGKTIARTGRPGRPHAWCSNTCREKAGALPAGQGKRIFRPCSHCGDLRPAGRTSARSIICLPCRRRARGLAPDQLYRDAVRAGLLNKRRGRKQCEWCDGEVTEPRRYKFCSEKCGIASRRARGQGFSRAKASAKSRGYGRPHQRLRAQLLPLAYGKNCHLCGDVMQHGDDLHLDHNEDRTGWRGMVHARCNLRDGARRGNERQRQMRLERGWRPGQDPSTRRRHQTAARAS